MDIMENIFGPLIGLVIGISATGLILTAFPKGTAMYDAGVRDAYKDAFKNGVATKEIGANDEVVYRWKELHKIGYEY